MTELDSAAIPPDLFERIFRSSFDAIVLSRVEDATVIAANEAFFAMSGYAENEVVGKSAIDMWVEASDRDEMVKELQATGSVEAMTSRFRRKSGEIMYGELTVQLIHLDGIACILTNAREVTERVLAERELERTVDELRSVDASRRDLIARLNRAQDDERQRIAGDLHDDLIQQLAVWGLHLASLERRANDDATTTSLRSLQLELSATMTRVRRLTLMLWPEGLHERGLVQTLAASFEEADLGEESLLRIQDDLVVEPSAELSSLAYRILQEAMWNARKHAQASYVQIHISSPEGGGLQARITDDGRGFDLGDKGEAGHFGLVGMKERAELAGGSVTIASTPGEGTVVDLFLPDAAPL